jgi:phage terminase small subunit
VKRPPDAPAHLARDGRRLWRDVALEYSVDDSGGLALLEIACTALDRMRAAQRAIKRYGVVIPDRYGGRRLNPACALERDSRAGFLAALRALNLDLEPLRDRAE